MHAIWNGLAAIGFSSIAQVAFAVHPTITHTPVNDTSTDFRCGFEVTVQGTGTLIDITYTDSQGAFHDFEAFPQGTQVMTNVATGKTITLNVAGPGKFTFNPDGSVQEVILGSSSFVIDPDNVAVVGWFLTNGKVVVSIDPLGNLTITRTGTLTNLCNELTP